MDSLDIVRKIKEDPDLLMACDRFEDYFYTNAKELVYKPFKKVYQSGPTCGLTALGMYVGVDFDGVEKILEESKRLGYSKSGEMFSARNMGELTRRLVDKDVELFKGYLDCEETVKFLSKGGVMLVPYDSDWNYEPCLCNGHKAHWALVCGVIVCNGGTVYVIARQGKSKRLGIWSLSLLAASNAQLNEVALKRLNPDEYIIPDGGINGDDGLCNKSILIHDYK